MAEKMEIQNSTAQPCKIFKRNITEKFLFLLINMRAHIYGYMKSENTPHASVTSLHVTSEYRMDCRLTGHGWILSNAWHSLKGIVKLCYTTWVRANKERTKGKHSYCGFHTISPPAAKIWLILLFIIQPQKFNNALHTRCSKFLMSPLFGYSPGGRVAFAWHIRPVLPVDAQQFQPLKTFQQLENVIILETEHH